MIKIKLNFQPAPEKASVFRGIVLSGETRVELNGVVVPIKTSVMRFCDIPNGLLRFGKKETLSACLSKWEGFSEEEIVTLVFFELL